MPSQFFGLNIAYKGLLASNAALTTTANNIANVQTDGYSRQQVITQASTPIRVFQTYGCAGAGVETLAIERVRDEFYDNKFWASSTTTGQYEMKQYYCGNLETYFHDDGKNSGFKTIFDQFNVNALEELLKNPGDNKTKANYIGAAGNLTEYFNGLAGNLEKMQRDINLEIKAKVEEISSLAGEIATLNTQINTIEVSGGAIANELRDRRTLLIDQLSQIVDVEVSETPVVDTNYPDRPTGSNRFIVRIAGGQLLVDGSDFNGLECRARKDYEKVHQTDIDGLYDIYWSATGQEFNPYNAAMSGQLKGLIDMRDGNNGEYFKGEILSVGTTEDERFDTVKVRVSDPYLMDLNKCNLSDQGGKISLGNQVYYYDAWECTISYDENGNQQYDYTFTLSGPEKNSRRVTNDREKQQAQIGHKLDYQGIPYYMNQMNEWVRTYTQKFNQILRSGYDSNGQKGCNLFTGQLKVAEETIGADGTKTVKKQYSFPDETDYGDYSRETFEKNGALTVKSTDDSYYKMTAHNVSIVSALEQDSDLLATRFEQGDGAEQGDLLREIRLLGTDKNKMSFRGASANEFLQCELADVALNTSAAKRFYSCNQDITGAIDTQRMSISGVDEDEEAVNLVKYRNAYNLSSKMIQIFSEIYDRLIRETGV